LAVEQLLAGGNDARRLAGDRFAQGTDRLIEPVRRDDPIDETPGACGLSVDEFAGDQHIEGFLAADVTTERHRRCRAEQA
jgi:hypothetical protein